MTPAISAPTGRGQTRTLFAELFSALCFSFVVPATSAAQVDFYNTDAGRPLRIEDAYTIEHRGIEFQAAPLRVERSRTGAYAWGAEPRLEFGVLPRTQIDLGVPFVVTDVGGRTIAGAAGIDVAVLHNLNIETSIPALAVGLDVFLPAGAFGPTRTYVTALGVVTRSFPSLGAVRVHANVQYTFGERLASGSSANIGSAIAGPQAQEVSRWLAGAAIDRTFPLWSTLVSAEVYARRPLEAGRAIEVSAGAGVRHQLTPRWALDGGVGRRLTGDEQAWYATGGLAVAFGLHPFRKPGT